MRLPRFQVTVRGMMVLILLIGLVSALTIQSIRLARRDREFTRIARALANYRRAADQMERAEQKYGKGGHGRYAEINAATLNLKKALFELETSTD
jgi:type II secretory pathway pseudopilin PulG